LRHVRAERDGVYVDRPRDQETHILARIAGNPMGLRSGRDGVIFDRREMAYLSRTRTLPRLMSNTAVG
jgi:hypothetical protein